MITYLLNTIALIAIFNGNPVQMPLDYPVPYQIQYGWYNDQVVYFVPFASSSLSLSQDLSTRINYLPLGGAKQLIPLGFSQVQYAPKLNCVLTKDAVNDVYIVNNNRDIVFSSHPVQDTAKYTPLWRVHFLQPPWGVARTYYGNEADVKAAIQAGKLVEQFQNFPVLDASIVGDETGWVIPQARDTYFQPVDPPGYVFLPTFVVAYPNLTIQRYPYYPGMLLVDASDPDLAESTGANYAPRLANVDNGDFNPAYSTGRCANVAFAFTWGNQPVPPGQLPVIDQLPYPGITTVWQNQYNQDYNPVRTWLLFNHDGLQPTAVYSTPNAFRFLAQYRPSTVVDLDEGIVTNSPINSGIYLIIER